ncbi:hypothetical protein AGMMS49975_29190 [Clostridia bacterium]|nr:hypothetical protein AGMMS49975_29190 [Clostridia bacterium]
MPPNLVYPSVARTLSARYDSSPCIDRGQNFIVVENHPADSRFKLSKDNIIQTLSSRMGTGGNNEPMILESHQKSYSYDCRNHNKELSATLQSKGGSGGLNYINPIFCLNELKYIVRRLTPLECCRLQGFEDFWCTDLDTQKPTKKEIDDWAKVFETHRNATNPKKKPKTRKYIEKWLKHPQSNSAEYKMWGNSLCVNCAYTVLKGIADELGANQKTKVRHHGEKKAIGSFHLEYPKQESFPARQMD